MNTSSLKIQSLQAGSGDCFVIKFQDRDGINRNILIDGGNNFTDFKKNLKEYSLELVKQNEKFDIIIVTHIDQDHIKGVLYLLNERKKDPNGIGRLGIDSFWFNSAKHNHISRTNLDIGRSDMDDLEAALEEKE